MKAFIYDEYGPPQTLRMAEAGKPAPNAGEVLVKVLAVSVMAGVRPGAGVRHRPGPGPSSPRQAAGRGGSMRPCSGRRLITQRGGEYHPPDADCVLLAESEVRRRPAAQSCSFGGAQEERCHARAGALCRAEPRWQAPGAGWSAVARNGPLTPIYPRPLLPVNGPVGVVYSRSAGNGGQTSCTRSASAVRRASCPVRSCGRRPCRFCLAVGKVIFNR
jgi:hypothetical protein